MLPAARATRATRATLWDLPLALWRDGAGTVGAVWDRCPHRHVPLSRGRCENGTLRCPYHGWCFAPDGRCVEIPGLSRPLDLTALGAQALPTCERDGLIWVFAGAAQAATPPGPTTQFRPAAGYQTLHHSQDFAGDVPTVAENALDVFHTPFVHRGLFRGGQRRRIEVQVWREADAVHADYIGEARPSGLLGRLLAPGQGEVQHRDSFRLPCFAEVDYRLGPDSHLHLCAALSPLGEAQTRMFATAHLRLPHGTARLAAWLKPLALQVLRQDAAILQALQGNRTRFGASVPRSTELDVLAPHIDKLWHGAALAAATTRRTELWRRLHVLL